MNSPQPERGLRLPGFLSASAPRKFAGVVYALFFILGVLTISQGYIDFGDGNYLYISWRMACGAHLYQDIVSPQPPMHLLVGRTLIGLGEALGGGMLTLVIVRLFSILLHIVTGWLVMRICRILFDDEWTEALAGCIFLFLPIGLFWSKGYQSEPLEIFFLTAAFLALLHQTPRSWIVAAIFSTLALFTNMTAVPYIALFIVFALTQKRTLAMRFLVVLGCSVAVLLLLFHVSSGGAYLQNVIFNQVGTFNRTDPVGYALSKIIRQGGNILIAEGGFVFCSALGAVVYLAQESLKIRKVAVWYLFWGLGSIIFVSKGGTEDYIFCIGEPMVAVFSAFFLRFFYLGTFSTWMRERSGGPISQRLTRGAALLTLCLVLMLRGGWEILDTYSEGKYENRSEGVQRVVDYIEQYSEPGETIWAPPYYAFLTRRPIPEDASSTFIWYIRYVNHKFYHDPDPVVAKVIGNIVNQLDGEQVPVVVLNRRRGQLGSLEEIQAAVEQNYTLVDARIPSRNEDLWIFITQKKVPKLNLRVQ